MRWSPAFRRLWIARIWSLGVSARNLATSSRITSVSLGNLTGRSMVISCIVAAQSYYSRFCFFLETHWPWITPIQIECLGEALDRLIALAEATNKPEDLKK
jgi:hypothetical protein